MQGWYARDIRVSGVGGYTTLFTTSTNTMKPVIDYYDQLAANYDHERFANSYGRYIDLLERGILAVWLGDADKADVVDFGCGTGRLLDFAMTGVDGSAQMLRVAAGKFPDRRLIHANLTDIPLADRSATAALCFHVLMHLDPETLHSVLRTAARIVRPGGKLIMDIPSAPRRALGRRPPSGWHGDTAAGMRDIREWTAAQWKVRRWRGLLFFPIHRIPARLRPVLRRLDAWIGRTWLARYSSYYVIELERLA